MFLLYYSTKNVDLAAEDLDIIINYYILITLLLDFWWQLVI